MANFGGSGPQADGAESSPQKLCPAASPFSNPPHLALSAQTPAHHPSDENEHDARHGGSNGCPSWPVAGRNYDR